MLFASPVNDGQGRVTHHFLSYLDITRRYDAEGELRTLTSEVERRVVERTHDLEASNARLNHVYFENRSFSSSGSRRSLVQRRSATTKGSWFRRASKSATRRVRSSAQAWQW